MQDGFQDIDNDLTPWEAYPHQLVNWWDMEKFSADVFLAIAKYLAEVRGRAEKHGPLEARINPGRLKDGSSGHTIVMNIKGLCAQIGLRVSIKCVDSILANRDREITVAQAVEEIAQLERTILWEMEDKLFMYIPPERSERYDQKELLGKEVNAKFPMIQYDATEAGNCYACGRSTAVVFHLMRIMEVGVQELGTKLGVALTSEKNWQNILDEINKAIKALDQKVQATKEFAAASANLYSVKLAWRNEVMHPKDTYTLEEADNLIRQVKMFMENLVAVI